MLRKKCENRIILVISAFFVMFTLLGADYYALSVKQTNVRAAEKNAELVINAGESQGTIYDRNMNPLVNTRTICRAVVVPSAVNADEIGRKSMVEDIELKPNSNILTPPEKGWRVCQIGYPYTISFTIDWAKETPGTVLCRSERSTFYLSDPIRGMLGFSRDGYLFNFKYCGKPGKRETLRLEGDNEGISLYADGKLVERLKPDVGYRSNEKKTTYKIMRTLVFPLQQSRLSLKRKENHLQDHANPRLPLAADW